MLTSSDQIRNLVARYVRNVDLRDHQAQIALFSTDAAIRMLSSSNGEEELRYGPLIGGAAFADASAALRQAMPANRVDRHCTTDHLISIEGDIATLDAQFLVVRTEALDTGGCSTDIVETGHYRWAFRRDAHGWLACTLDIVLDSPVGQSASKPKVSTDVQHGSGSLA